MKSKVSAKYLENRKRYGKLLTTKLELPNDILLSVQTKL